jgi:CHAT domain-containing protein
MRADLVVPFACDTGHGTATRGGDLIGLARGLLGAGRCVSDASTWFSE